MPVKRGLGSMLVGSYLATAATRFPDATAIVCADTGRRFTFRQMDERANRLGHALEGLGLRKGDVLAFLVSNRAEIVDIYFALARTGIIGIPLNYRLAAPEIDSLAQSMGATALIYEDRFAALAAPTAARVRDVIRIGPGASHGEQDYEALTSAAAATALERDIREEDPYYFNLTSGTTGLPKSYVLTQYNNSTVGPMFMAFDMSRQDVAMTVFPAFGRVGLAWILGAMLFGVPNVLCNFAPDRVLELMRAEGVTILNLVPTMAAMLIQAVEAGAAPPTSLRGIVFAGASLPQPVREQTQQHLCPDLYEYYGMQETGVLVVSTPDDRKRNPASQGRAMVFCDIRIIDDAGNPLPAGSHGEIIGRSPNAVTGYFGNTEKTAETFRNGWVHTGDIGVIDAEGFLTISGRKKDMIVTGGQNVHAAEVEGILLAHPHVADAAVFALPDDFWGEKVAVLLVPGASGAVEDEQLTQWCRERLAGFKIPRTIFWQDEPLPRTPTGKVQKFLLVDRFTASA